MTPFFPGTDFDRVEGDLAVTVLFCELGIDSWDWVGDVTFSPFVDAEFAGLFDLRERLSTIFAAS